MVLIAPSILSGDFGRLGEECERMLQAGADWIHVDVMDGHFVPNLTIGPMVVQAIRRRLPGAFLDCHLMVEDARKWGREFAKFASSITVHIECFNDSKELYEFFTCLYNDHPRLKLAVALKPNTNVSLLSNELLSICDMILVMTVEPGFGGQAMISDCLEKCRELRRRGYGKLIQVDGGVTVENCELVRESGADVIVAGTAIFKADDPAEAIRSMRA